MVFADGDLARSRCSASFALRCSSILRGILIPHTLLIADRSRCCTTPLHYAVPRAGSLSMRGTFRVSLRTFKHRPRTSPGSIKALYLSSTVSTVRKLSNDGHYSTAREQPPRSYNSQWLRQEGTFSKTVTVSNVSPVVGYSPLSPFQILTLTWSLLGRVSLVGHHSRMVRSRRQ